MPANRRKRGNRNGRGTPDSCVFPDQPKNPHPRIKGANPRLLRIAKATARIFDNEQPHKVAIREKIGGLTSDILTDIPAATALRVFSEIPPAKGDAEKDEIKQLQNVFSNAVAQTPFVPVHRRRKGQARRGTNLESSAWGGCARG